MTTVLEEGNLDCREKMLTYLIDLMEDATDFLWVNAKAAHAVLLCEIKRGSVDWLNTQRIDRIRRAHAQKHNPAHKQTSGDTCKKLWYCKAFQSGSCHFTKDHGVSGKLHKHICAHCLSQGRFMGHSEKECNSWKKSFHSKNEKSAAQH